MKHYNSYIISLTDIDLSMILKTWKWLIEADKTIIALTKMGDASLKDNDNKLYHLDTGLGELNGICENYYDFMEGKVDAKIYDEILLPYLVDELEKCGKILNPKQVFAYYKIPLIGGAYEKGNIYSLNVYEHYSLTGEIHLQLKGLSNGTKIEFVTE